MNGILGNGEQQLSVEYKGAILHTLVHPQQTAERISSHQHTTSCAVVPCATGFATWQCIDLFPVRQSQHLEVNFQFSLVAENSVDNCHKVFLKD